MKLVPLELWLAPAEGPLLPRLQQALHQAGGAGGEPLRWAITAADTQRGLRLEAVLIQPDGAPLAEDAPLAEGAGQGGADDAGVSRRPGVEADPA